MGHSSSVHFLNGYFRAQEVTGQQRFAHEIAAHLAKLLPRLTELVPSSFAARSRMGAWVELQARLPYLTAGGTLISLTSRTPLVAKTHVVTIHDLFPITHPEWYSRSYIRLHRPLLRYHLRHAAGVVVVSEPVRDQVSALARPGMPITVAPNAPSAALATYRDSFNGHIPERFFLAVGSLDPRKNLSRLIRAYKTLPSALRSEMPLIIAGGDAAIFANQSSPGSRAAGVIFLGRVTDSQLAALYARASVLVSASLDEGFGLPLVEAARLLKGTMAVSDIPVYRWVMEGAPVIYFDPLSTESIAAGLATAVSRTPEPDSLRVVGQRFSWAESAQRVADLVGDVDEYK